MSAETHFERVHHRTIRPQPHPHPSASSAQSGEIAPLPPLAAAALKAARSLYACEGADGMRKRAPIAPREAGGARPKLAFPAYEREVPTTGKAASRLGVGRAGGNVARAMGRVAAAEADVAAAQAGTGEGAVLSAAEEHAIAVAAARELDLPPKARVYADLVPAAEPVAPLKRTRMRLDPAWERSRESRPDFERLPAASEGWPPIRVAVSHPPPLLHELLDATDGVCNWAMS